MAKSITTYLEGVEIPDSEGVWMDVKTKEELDVYPLIPADGTLCFWVGDIGSYLDGTEIWSTDEWLGHIPVIFLQSHRISSKWIKKEKYNDLPEVG